MKERYNYIDFIRGFAIINMILFHLFYDLVYIFGENLPFFESRGASIWQNMIAMTFIITSGISYNFGKKNSRKIILLFICAAILSATTIIIIPEEFIAFGIIHFFAFATLFLSIFDGLFKKINPFVGIIIFTLLFISTRFITNGYIYLLNSKYYLPENFYGLGFLFWLGFPNNNFISSDYFPVIPWLFLFIVGYYIGRIIITKKPVMKKKSFNPINIIGRHSLFLYIIHQPVIYIVLSLIYKIKLF